MAERNTHTFQFEWYVLNTSWRTITGAVRNVLIEDENGNRVIRPFRGLRRAKEDV